MVFIDTSSIQYWLFLMPVFHSSSLNSFTNPLIYQFDGWFRLIHVNYLFFCMLNPKFCWWISLKPPIEPPGAARASPVFGASGSPRRARQQRQGSMGSLCKGKMKMDMDLLSLSIYILLYYIYIIYVGNPRRYGSNINELNGRFFHCHFWSA